MRIVIAGAGEVGFHLAELLSNESHDITIIDNSKDRLAYVEAHLDVFTLKGNAISLKTLKEATISKADLFITATSSETTNITSSIIGKKMGAAKTIARINNVEFVRNKDVLDFTSLGIDALISPQELAAREIERLIEQSSFTDTFEFSDGKLSAIGIHLEECSPLVNKTLAETASLNPQSDFITVAIQRDHETIIPRGNTTFKCDDQVYFISTKAGISKVAALTGIEKLKIKNIMILGGSKIGFKAARNLCEEYKIKLIEINREKCLEIAELLPNILVINGDGHDVELLEDENLEEMDAFISVTENSETNIMSCLVAKNKGVKKTIALVENIDYLHLSQTIGIDTMINKKLIAANNIFRHIREGEVVSLASLHGVEAEVLEFEVKAGSKVTKKPIKELKFPRTAIIGGLVRDGVGTIAMGDFTVQPDDKVVVFCLADAISKVEDLFK